MSMEELIEISRYFGKTPGYVLAGGGNTSWKDGKTLFIKGSGMALADAAAASFVRIDRDALARIWEKTYPESSAERESAVLADMMAAREAGEEKRPSVETLLHGIMPFNFVVHLHPALVNGLTCSQRGETAMTEIFGDEAIWIPSSNPGYVLAKKVKTAMDAYHAKHGKPAAVIFLQNHGVFVGDNSAAEIKEKYAEIMNKIGAKIKRQPDFSDEVKEICDASFAIIPGLISEIIKTLQELTGSVVIMRAKELASLLNDRASFAPVSSAFTPDHIVYSGSDPLFTEAITGAELKEAWKSHTDKTGREPKIVAVQGLGVFGAAATEKAANLALDLFCDAVKVAVYAESFGGPSFMSREQIGFINNWEVESYRSKVSS